MLNDDTFLEWTRGREQGAITQRDVDLAGDVRLCQLTLYTLVRLIHARRIVEVGTADGSTTLALLKAASETGGEVWSMDPSDCDDAKRLVRDCGYGEIWHFTQETSRAFWPKFDGAIDFCYVDGDHAASETELDFTNALAHLRPGGILVAHDWHTANDEAIPLATTPEQFGAYRGMLAACAQYNGRLYSLPCAPGLFSPMRTSGAEGGFVIVQKAYDSMASTRDERYFERCILPSWITRTKEGAK